MWYQVANSSNSLEENTVSDTNVVHIATTLHPEAVLAANTAFIFHNLEVDGKKPAAGAHRLVCGWLYQCISEQTAKLHFNYRAADINDK